MEYRLLLRYALKNDDVTIERMIDQILNSYYYGYRKEQYNWILENCNKITYRLEKRRTMLQCDVLKYELFVIFEDIEEAILFKLKFGE